MYFSVSFFFFLPILTEYFHVLQCLYNAEQQFLEEDNPECPVVPLQDNSDVVRLLIDSKYSLINLLEDNGCVFSIFSLSFICSHTHTCTHTHCVLLSFNVIISFHPTAPRIQ